MSEDAHSLADKMFKDDSLAKKRKFTNCRVQTAVPSSKSFIEKHVSQTPKMSTSKFGKASVYEPKPKQPASAVLKPAASTRELGARNIKT